MARLARLDLLDCLDKVERVESSRVEPSQVEFEPMSRPGLLFNGLHLRNPRKLHLPTPEGQKAELA